MEQPANQIERERVHRFIETVQAIRDGRARGVTLSEYWPREIADAIQFLIDGAVRDEREACAIVAEATAEPGGPFTHKQTFVEALRQKICMEIAVGVRAQR
jgi:hypothetical protein